MSSSSASGNMFMMRSEVKQIDWFELQDPADVPQRNTLYNCGEQKASQMHSTSKTTAKFLSFQQQKKELEALLGLVKCAYISLVTRLLKKQPNKQKKHSSYYFVVSIRTVHFEP